MCVCVAGSPYHPKVVCARKVLVVGGWQHYMDNRERVHLVVNEEKQIPFDVSEAGPGTSTSLLVCFFLYLSTFGQSVLL